MQSLLTSLRSCVTRPGSILIGFGMTFVLLLAACGSSTNAGGTPTAGATSKLTIAFVMGAEADPFFKAMKIGAAAEAAAQGVNLLWQGDPSGYSPATQIPYVDQVLALHPSCLLTIPTDPDAFHPEVTKATAMNIPVINVDTDVTD